MRARVGGVRHLSENVSSAQLRGETLELLSLYWLRPEEELWMDLTSQETIEELTHGLKEGFGLDVSASELAEQLPEYSVAHKEYVTHLTTTFGKKAAAPIESIYKIWTNDPTCDLPHARETGYLMGDSALHMKELLEQLQLEIPEDHLEMPDHISVNLNVAGIFAGSGNEEAFHTFVSDHLDWLGDFSEKLKAVSPESFYLYLSSIIEGIHEREGGSDS